MSIIGEGSGESAEGVAADVAAVAVAADGSSGANVGRVPAEIHPGVDPRVSYSKELDRLLDEWNKHHEAEREAKDRMMDAVWAKARTMREMLELSKREGAKLRG